MTTPWHPHVSADEHAKVEEIQRAIASIDSKLEWLRRYVNEAEELQAERAELGERKQQSLRK
jgi:hypothetical protein